MNSPQKITEFSNFDGRRTTAGVFEDRDRLAPMDNAGYVGHESEFGGSHE
jgi:hypothetical protein